MYATSKNIASGAYGTQDRGQLCISSFIASTNSQNKFNHNGLPLTPSTTEILGRFQKLQTLEHPNLSEYIDLSKGKHERLFLVSEVYDKSLSAISLQKSSSLDFFQLKRCAFQVLLSLKYLQDNGIVHRNLCPSNILFDSKDNVKLAGYGLYYVTGKGHDVDFPIGSPFYMAPEVLSCGHVSYNESIWSLGVILFEAFVGESFWICEENELYTIMEAIHNLVDKNKEDPASKDDNFWSKAFKEVKGINTEALTKLSEHSNEDEKVLWKFISSCLVINSDERATASQLLSHPLFDSIIKEGFPSNYQLWWDKPLLFSDRFSKISDEEILLIDTYPRRLSDLSLLHAYHLWKISGGNLELEMIRHGALLSTPPVQRVPRIVRVLEGEEIGSHRNDANYYSDIFCKINLEELEEKILNTKGVISENIDLDYEHIKPLDTQDIKFHSSKELEKNEDQTQSEIMYDFEGRHENSAVCLERVPLLIRERDPVYQFHRISLFIELLRQYPASRDEIIHHAKLDIPPILRGQIWASILGIVGNPEAVYDSFDKESETDTDRQVYLDVPRCHQYNSLLASSVGHEKLKRILKCWTVANGKLVYWQGLDSLCAPFLTLNFSDEPLAFSCLQAFIPRFLKNFFTADNSDTIQEHLAVFQHILSYHDPELSSHLKSIGFLPELYAIPWFLTLFTHVFPLHKIYHLWDKLLVGTASLPLFMGVSILRQIREVLLASEFNDCIGLFSEAFPDVDIERCFHFSQSMFENTPHSIISTIFKPGHEHTDVIQDVQCWWEQPIPVSVRKSELAPRINIHDLVKIGEHAIVIDTRDDEEFLHGHIPYSLNMQPSYLEVTVFYLKKLKRDYHIVLSDRGDSGPQVGELLVNNGFPRVSILAGGMDAIRVNSALYSLCSCRPVKQMLKAKLDNPITFWRCRTTLQKNTP
ncbi:hypothetical protein K7432_003771 [Basidiobolus ranarum]|uniref:non-specific serine/threonine protein kinase n=1 Tax=Basidiobolus ranarum TaxID=34480 RepID=A0ABR2WZE5_9FUNG